MITHTNPFSFGLDIALPPPAGPTFYEPTHTLHGNPFNSSSDPIYGGAAAAHALNSNPFSFGLGPLTGYYDPFYGGATGYTDVQYNNPFAAADCWDDTYTGPTYIDDYALPVVPAIADADVQYSNPFAAGCWDGTYTEPTYIDDYALPAVPIPDSPRTPVSGTSNPFNADNNAVFATDVPAPWESDPYYNAYLQPAIDEPEPVVYNNNETCNDSTAQLCASYGDDIEATLRAQEEDISTRPSPDYLNTTQAGRITPKTRTDLVCWMMELCERYKNYDLATATLHRAVSYVDRFLSTRRLDDVTTRRLNLLGGAAVFAAAKYEDQGAAHKLGGATEIARRGGFADDGKEVVGMERNLMAALGYRLGGPTAHTFVDHFVARGYYGDSLEEEELRFRACDLADVSLLDYGCVGLKPSAVAAAGMFLATLTLLKPSYGEVKRWNKRLKEVTGYMPKDLERGVEAIRSLVPKDDGNGNGFDIDIFPMFYADPDN